MSNKKKVIILLIGIMGIVLNIYVLRYFKIRNKSREFELSYTLISNKKDTHQIFYGQKKDDWNEEKSLKEEYTTINKPKKMEFLIPLDAKIIRIDFGTSKQMGEIDNLKIEFNGNIKEISLKDKKNIDVYNEIKIDNNKDKTIFISEGNDPFIVLSSKTLDLENFSKLKLADSSIEKIAKFILCLIIDVFLFLFLKSKNLSNLNSFLKDLYSKKRLIIALSLNDFKQKYTSSYLGLFWSFVQPLVNIGVFWFVFSVGFRTADIEKGIPFILWLVCGLIPWYYFSEVLNSGTNVLYEYSYMLKQMVFNPIVLPSIKILSNLITHLFFCILIIIICISYKMFTAVYILQIFYYLFCMIYLLFGTCLLFSSLKVFLPDIGEIVAVILQLGVWITPIMWNIKMVPERLQWIFKINPMYYIITGYRDTFIYKIWFWERQGLMLSFFLISTFFLIVGVLVFKKLKPHFNDVL